MSVETQKPAVAPIPRGYPAVSPYLVVPDVDRVLEFLEKSFDTERVRRSEGPDGRVLHAEVRLGGSPVMLGRASREWQARQAMLYVYVGDVDAVYERALAAGGIPVMPPTDMFYGDRHGAVDDPAGNQWWIATHIEDVSEEELERRNRERFEARG
ncbi:MAG: VOC family protein [Thermoanaerobaculia bacterium]